MKTDLWTFDAHCHWSDTRIFATSHSRIPELKAQGLRGFLLGGVEPEEWERQTRLSENFPGLFWRAFGLHPYFVARAGEEALARAWLLLTQLAPQVEAIGETGLDFRKIFVGESKDQAQPLAKRRQLEFFARHLELAQALDRPVIVHVVRAHEEALQQLAAASARGLVHGFTGNWKVAQRYLEHGFMISLGARLLHENQADLVEVARKVPLDSLLIESDGPDQPPPGQTAHDSLTVWAVAGKIAQLRNLALESVVEKTRNNLLRMLKKEWPP